MSSHISVVVIVLKTATLLLGGLITLYALKAYRRTGAPALRLLTLGFGVVTMGSLLAGVADQLIVVETQYALIIESALTTIGFAIILYSLYVD